MTLYLYDNGRFCYISVHFYPPLNIGQNPVNTCICDCYSFWYKACYLVSKFVEQKI